MKITPENIYNLVGGHCPGQDQRWVWISPEVEIEVNRIILNALTQIEPDLREVWIKREVEKEDFDSLADNRERGRQLHAKALRRMRAVIIKMGKFRDLKDSHLVTYVPDGPRDPAWASVAEAASITGLSKRHIRHLARVRAIESQKVRGMVYIRQESLRTWVESEPIRGVKKGTWH